ncbi:MAG TPA: beta-ketoacyl-ACP synthase III [Acidimicrobiia bacterium]
MTAAAGIVGWGTAVPEGRVTNADLAQRVDTSDEWIVERTGIRERRVAGPGETTATLAVEAATHAIKRAGLVPADVDLMIIATVTPEQPIPHTGAFVGEALGLQCGSFDMNAACAGFVYELVVGASMLQMGYDRVLLIGAETLSRIIDPEDRTTTVLFGDGAGAAVLAPTREAPGVLAWDLGCDGSAAGLLEIRAGGSRLPASAATIADRDHFLKMAGQEVFRRAVRAVVESAMLTLGRAGVDAGDVAWFVPHQANGRIIEAAAHRLGFEPERTLVNIDRFGNTSSASIPLALFEAVDDGRVHDGDLVLCSGFGAGMTWASTLLRWGAR